MVLQSKQVRTIVKNWKIKYEQVQRKCTSSVHVGNAMNSEQLQIYKTLLYEQLDKSHLSALKTKVIFL